MKKEYFWTIRINRLVVQFATEKLSLKWNRPAGLPGKQYSFLSPRNTKVDFINE
jgi:hypothetical protein